MRNLGAGAAVEDIIADYPRLTRDDIKAAPTFTADYIADEDLVYG